MNDMEIACFISVARTGSFTISARELSSTQQAVSRNIQSLENELGFPLLHRGSQSVSLTWAGQRFLQWRIDHDAQLSTLERRSRRLSAEGKDELYIGWNDWTGCPPGLDDDIRGFRQAYPHVNLHLRQGSTEDIASMLSDGNVDIAILPEYSTHNLGGLIVSPPFMTQPLYVISRDFEQLPPYTTLSSMRYLAAPMGEQNEDSVRRRIHMFCAELGIVPKVLEILPNVRSTFSELLCGNSYTIAPAPHNHQGLHPLPLPGQNIRLVFVTSQAYVSPWVSLFESYVRQRRHSL